MLVDRDAGTHLGVVANKLAWEKVTELAYKRDKDFISSAAQMPAFVNVSMTYR
jgi:hypothetical protein